MNTIKGQLRDDENLIDGYPKKAKERRLGSQDDTKKCQASMGMETSTPTLFQGP